MANNALETAIMSADLTRHHIPIEVEEIKVAGEKDNVMQQMLRSEFDGLKSWLVGPDGHGGVLDGIKEELSELKTGQRQIEDQQTTMITAQIRDRADLEALIAINKNDINEVGTIARGARDSLKHHCDDMADKRRFRIEMAAPYIALVIALAGVLVAVFV